MQPVYDYLDQLGITYRVHEHPPLMTVDDENQSLRQLRGLHCKNLFVHNRNKSAYFLVSVAADKQVDLQALRRLLDVSKLMFASSEDLHTLLGLTPGSVTPFGLLNDTERRVTPIIDEDFFSAEFVNFHPNINTATVELTPADFEKFLNATGHAWQRLTIPVLTTESVQAGE